MESSPSVLVVSLCAAGYVLSGVCQPLIMTLCKHWGLADPTAQLYMVFYYLGPSSLALCGGDANRPKTNNNNNNRISSELQQQMINQRRKTQAVGVAAFDVCAQAMNYTGASLAGPTVFAIIYSSVTIWTAIFSRVLLARTMHHRQWLAIGIVVVGLSLTAWDSVQIGPDVSHGTILIVAGSAMHAATYVFSEQLMLGPGGLSVQQTASIQGMVALTGLGLWQLFYTLPRWEQLIGSHLREAHTTLTIALSILFGFALTNLVHSWTFFHTLRHVTGGATSAGILKALQAVLVFGASHVLYCDTFGGEEMCFSMTKLWSLLTVTGGVTLFGISTARKQSQSGYSTVDNPDLV